MVHIHMRFLCNVYPYAPFSGLFPPQMPLVPVPNMEWAMHEFCDVPALGTPETAKVR